MQNQAMANIALILLLPFMGLPTRHSFPFFLFLFLCLVGGRDRLVASYTPNDIRIINCGSSASETVDDVEWVGDEGSGAASPFLQTTPGSPGVAASTQIQDVNLPSTVPFLTARIFTSPGFYYFPVTPGRHWLRLYFYPFAYQGFDPNNAAVTVMVNTAPGGDGSSNVYMLINDLNVTAEMKALNLVYVYREFSVNVSGDFLQLGILPASFNSSYGIINGLELVSMPELFDKQTGVTNVNTQLKLPLGLPSLAFQTEYRLNVGGPAVGPSKDSLRRSWVNDLVYIPTAAFGVEGSFPESNISYGLIPNYTAPLAVYDTARVMTNDNDVNLEFNLTWVFKADPSFTYYFRFHLCELIYDLDNQRVFDIFINGMIGFSGVDVVALAGDGTNSAPQTATYLDFTYINKDRTNITVEIGPNPTSKPQYYNAILNGLEIFKMNDTSGNLQGAHAVYSPPPSSSMEPPSSFSSPSFGGDNKVAIVGGVSGSLVALGLLVVLACCICRRQKGAKSGKNKNGEKASMPGWIPLSLQGNSHSMSKVSTSSHKSAGSGSYVSSAASANLCRYFTFQEIVDVTDNFNEEGVIGVGGFGKVYQGELEDGTKVAVKRGNPTSEQGVTEFQTEIELLTKLRHRHLVSLIGFCEEHSEMILVYDFMANGPLRGHLFGSDLPKLSWKKRLDICIGSARGLHYLHTGAAHRIIHRDVKTTNILLDENLVAKVSDFGLSKTGPTLENTHVSTAVKGSFGYLDPEYFRRQQLTEKSDVYSFGVVLFEVLCARPAINPALPRDQVNLAEWAMHWQRKKLIQEVMDPFLQGRVGMDSLRKFAETAEKCLAEEGFRRPSMGDVLWNLEYALQLHETSAEREADMGDVADGDEMDQMAEEDEEERRKNAAMASAIAIGAHNLLIDVVEEAEGEGQEEDPDDVTASAVFSQMVNSQGR